MLNCIWHCFFNRSALVVICEQFTPVPRINIFGWKTAVGVFGTHAIVSFRSFNTFR